MLGVMLGQPVKGCTDTTCPHSVEWAGAFHWAPNVQVDVDHWVKTGRLTYLPEESSTEPLQISLRLP